jgi:hypothetical protein
MNRLQIRELARKKLGETTAAFWSDDEINGYINDGCRDISYNTKSIKASILISTSDCTENTTAAGTSETSLLGIDPDIYSITEAYFDSGRWMKMEPRTIQEMDLELPGWRNAVGRTVTSNETASYNVGSTPGIPFIYYWDSELDVFGWYPPTSTLYTTSENIRIFYTKRHADMQADTSVPTLPEPMHLAITDYVCAIGYETRGQIERANDYWNKYRQRLLTYLAERQRQREDEDVVSKNYRNI